MKSLKVILPGLIAFTMLQSYSAEASRSDRRQAVQRGRIAEGVRSGELNRAEAVGLRHQARHVRRAERRAKVDGDYTVREKARIERKQDRLSRSIHKQKHDDQKRGD